MTSLLPNHFASFDIETNYMSLGASNIHYRNENKIVWVNYRDRMKEEILVLFT